MTVTNNLGITLVAQSQAQKEITINEAISTLDALHNKGAIDKDLATPPGSPATGDMYIIAASPTGAWSGKAKNVAYYNSGWKFVAPNEGMTIWVNDEDLLYAYNGSSWAAVSSGGGSIDPGITALYNNGVKDKDLATPPGSPVAGDVYIVAASPTGVWSGKAKNIAYYTTSWNFIAPNEGLTVWVNDENLIYSYNSSAWVVSGIGGTVPSMMVTGSTQSVTSGTSTLAAFATVGFDRQSNYTNTASNYKFTAPVAGVYQISATASVPVTTGNNYSITIWKNGAAVKTVNYNLASANAVQQLFVHSIMSLAANDYIQIYYFQDSGSSKTFSNSEFSICYMAA